MFYNDNFINIGKDIYVYKNFIDEKECSSIVAVIENLSNDEWQTLDDNTFVTKPLSEIKLIKEKFIKIVNNKLQLGKGSSVVKMNTGASLGRHYDDYDFKDSKENMINDPWPTPFASSGFDLDAVGVINQSPQMKINWIDKQNIYFQSETRVLHFPEVSNTDISLFSLEGKLVFKTKQNQLQMSIPTKIADGVYIVKLNNLSFKINLH